MLIYVAVKAFTNPIVAILFGATIATFLAMFYDLNGMTTHLHYFMLPAHTGLGLLWWLIASLGIILMPFIAGGADDYGPLPLLTLPIWIQAAVFFGWQGWISTHFS